MLNEGGVVTMVSTQVPIAPAGPRVTNITCMLLGTRVRNDLLGQDLSAYGKVLEITHATYRSKPTVKTGTRYDDRTPDERVPGPKTFNGSEKQIVSGNRKDGSCGSPRAQPRGGFPSVKLTASPLSLKTLLTILDDADTPTWPINHVTPSEQLATLSNQGTLAERLAELAVWMHDSAAPDRRLPFFLTADPVSSVCCTAREPREPASPVHPSGGERAGLSLLIGKPPFVLGVCLAGVWRCAGYLRAVKRMCGREDRDSSFLV
ncbi:hypothetical protein HPB47_008867 [Ixodes persulcatus]|uniref:Uncharacterized protein n=1 Tax=Ixodes persulcatus TaxID=34615 RepID=A0AC60P3H9_IXOPE|nr:hypothetical protein HPB47_008867 [Ixodes persulcatus]